MALAFGPSATTDASAVTVLTVADADKAQVAHFKIVNDGLADGFFTLDGGGTFRFMPSGSAQILDDLKGFLGVIQIKREGAQNLSAVHGDIW